AWVYEPGAPIVFAPGPLLPAANTGTMPAASKALSESRYDSDVPCELPHELLIRSGAFVGSAFLPAASVGASIQFRPARIVAVSLEPYLLNTLVAMNFAPGAMPMTWSAVPPTAVPAVCEPWPWSSYGAALPPTESYQL